MRQKSYAELKSEQVRRSFFLFAHFSSPQEEQDQLATLRERDRLLWPVGRARSLQPGGLGAALLGAAIFMSAHAPRTLRPLFDGPLHFGPALLDRGGMGVAVGGHLL